MTGFIRNMAASTSFYSAHSRFDFAEVSLKRHGHETSISVVAAVPVLIIGSRQPLTPLIFQYPRVTGILTALAAQYH